MGKEKWAVIDIGSNTIRLVIYEKSHSGSYKEAENIKTVARLRRYLNQEKVLQNEGITLLINILQGFQDIIHFHHISTIYCVATATIRQSKNQQEIVELVKEKTGFDIQVFSEKEETFFGYYAVSHSTPIDTGITIDMGGGSTEITYFQNRELVHYHSFPFGVVSLKEQFMKHDQITEMERNKLTEYILNSFAQLPWLRNLQVPIIAIGGSARNIAQIDQNLKKYPIAGIHQYIMTFSDLENIQTYLGQFSIEQLEKVEGLSKDRADIIIPALEVFVKLCEYCQSTSFMFSKKGLRDGISIKKSEINDKRQSTDQIIYNSVSELLADYGVDQPHAHYRGQLAEQLFKEVTRFYKVESKESFKKFVIRGAQLYYLGQYIENDSSSQHTFYLLANQSINGLLHKDRVKLAFIASYKNKTLLKQYMASFTNWFTKIEMDDIRTGGAVAKLACALDSSKRAIVKKVIIEEVSPTVLQLNVYCQGNAFVEQYETEKNIRQLEKATHRTIVLKFIEV
ncbi:Ppx/GppA family phosphatase [Bacillus sp. V3B]|uniref:Ppx/GppA family phosphatase n=1 Tax=Bacillus sp. V3B TaxID=2804915 RepID=UPI00210B94C9|nr:Ppx/GppA family phosphatase [Bacillus sp. V3B]MCQ6275091.1 Ppx/GppA family phosphatase [Bacillus sp. V3B]